MPEAGSTRNAILTEIRSYLTRHPNASDSARGVRWWLSPSHRTEPEASIQAALDELVTRHEVVPGQLADGTVIYRHSVRAESRHPLRQGRSSPAGDTGRDACEARGNDGEDVKSGDTRPRR